MLRLIAKGPKLPQLLTVATAAATLFSAPKSLFVSAAVSTKPNFCSATNPLIIQSSETTSRRTMATSTSQGKDQVDSVMVGALRKAGITKSPKDVTDEEWARILTPEQFAILRESHTERAFTGKYLENKEKGTYYCAACGVPLFKSETKFDSHCGWPSFYAEAKVEKEDPTVGGDGSNVGRRQDNAHGMVRTEIYCKKCGSHLGHVFDDGPQPTGERHCVNSASIEFVPNAVTKK